MRFSEHFQLNKSQAELDFVDIPLDTDIKLFVDPFAISIAEEPWLSECNDILINFFQTLMDTFRSGNEATARQIMSNLGEVNDTHLGLSAGRSQGSGIGKGLSISLFDAFAKSKAVTSGNLSDLSEFELFIEGISYDRISDMTINIIKSKLAQYTIEQCAIHSIQTTNVALGPCWNATRRQWENKYHHLPIANNNKIILIPKIAVRFNLAFSQDEYYSHYVLNFLQSENLSAGSSLVRTLKNGSRKVYKKDLKQIYPKSKDLLLDFSQQNPKVYEHYKSMATNKSAPILDEQLEEGRKDFKEIDYRKMAIRLDEITPGKQHAYEYHDHIIGVLQAILYPGITCPTKEQPLHDGRKKIDITFNNGNEGFFHRLSSTYKIKAPFIFFECKNYSSDVKNPEFDQITGRFNDKRGNFGIIVCRKIENTAESTQRCKDIAHDNRGYVLIFDDEDLKKMLLLRQGGRLKEIESVLDMKMRELLL